VVPAAEAPRDCVDSELSVGSELTVGVGSELSCPPPGLGLRYFLLAMNLARASVTRRLVKGRRLDTKEETRREMQIAPAGIHSANFT